MPLNIINSDGYILVESSTEMNYWDIMESISIIFSTPEYKHKNDIWVFRVGQLKMLLVNLDKIKDSAEKLYPKDSKASIGIAASILWILSAWPDIPLF